MTNNTPDYKDNLYFEDKMDCKNCPYTDEYCASGDCERDNDLTEQWKKGELPAGCYYIEDAGIYRTVYKSERDDVLEYEHSVYIPEMEDCIIVAPVPSYDEWKYKCEICEMFAEENQSLRKKLDIERCKNKGSYYYDGSPMDFLAECERDKKQNAQLKELLKRVNEHFKWVDHDDPFYVKDELWDDIKKVLENNNEVLK